MATATELTEEQIAEARREEEHRKMINWRPPKVPHGSIVVFYKEGRKTANSPVPMVAFSQSQSGRSIHLRPLAGGEARMNVRFIHDPRNKMLDDAELARSGAWDFTDEHYLVQSLKERVESSSPSAADNSAVDELKSQVSSLTEKVESLEKLTANLGETITKLIQGKSSK